MSRHNKLGHRWVRICLQKGNFLFCIVIWNTAISIKYNLLLLCNFANDVPSDKGLLGSITSRHRVSYDKWQSSKKWWLVFIRPLPFTDQASQGTERPTLPSRNDIQLICIRNYTGMSSILSMFTMFYVFSERLNTIFVSLGVTGR